MLSSKQGAQGRGEDLWVSFHTSAEMHWVQGCQESQEMESRKHPELPFHSSQTS